MEHFLEWITLVKGFILLLFSFGLMYHCLYRTIPSWKYSIKVPDNWKNSVVCLDGASAIKEVNDCSVPLSIVILPNVRTHNCQWTICHYTKCHPIKCHSLRIVKMNLILAIWFKIFILITMLKFFSLFFHSRKLIEEIV